MGQPPEAFVLQPPGQNDIGYGHAILSLILIEVGNGERGMVLAICNLELAIGDAEAVGPRPSNPMLGSSRGQVQATGRRGRAPIGNSAAETLISTIAAHYAAMKAANATVKPCRGSGRGHHDVEGDAFALRIGGHATLVI
jgi:hypothetical protein